MGRNAIDMRLPMNQVGDRGLTADDLLWNWARWCWSGETVGNMERYVSYEDDHRPIMFEHAVVVETLHAALPQHERMIVIAEYPQKNVMFGHIESASARCAAARRWIGSVTGVALTEPQYKLYLGFFKDAV